MAHKSYAGINIQFPISRLILEGTKTIETRTYPIPKYYIGKELALVETPGKTGKFKARVIGLIKFGVSFKYKSKTAFYADSKRHCVTPDSPWAWSDDKNKWGWPVEVIKQYSTPKPVKKKTGIIYTKDIVL